MYIKFKDYKWVQRGRNPGTYGKFTVTEIRKLEVSGLSLVLTFMEFG